MRRRPERRRKPTVSTASASIISSRFRSTVSRPRNKWGRLLTCGRLSIGQLPRLHRTAAVANRRALAMVYGSVQRQAVALSFLTAFRFMGILFLALVPLVLLMRKSTTKASARESQATAH